MPPWFLVALAAALLFVNVVDGNSFQHFSQSGLEAFDAGHYAVAVSNFRQASDLQPDNVEVLVNIGSAYLEMSKWEDARIVLERAMEIATQQCPEPKWQVCPANEEAWNYLRLLLDRPIGNDHKMRLREKLPHRIPRQQRRNVKENGHLQRLRPEDMRNDAHYKAATGAQPFILEGAGEAWSAPTKWTDEWLLATFGDTRAEAYPFSMTSKDSRPFLMPFRQAFEVLQERIRTGTVTSYTNPYPWMDNSDATYFHLNLDMQQWRMIKQDADMFAKFPASWLADDEWLDYCFSSDARRTQLLKAAHWRIILIGGQGAGMFNHQDFLGTASWHVTVRGTKEWHVCTPGENSRVYGSGGVDTFFPDYDIYPDFKNARCTLDNVTVGDALYYPADYFHQTLTHGALTLTLTGTVVNQYNWRVVLDRWASQCNIPSAQKHEFSYPDEMCDELFSPKCLAKFESMFDVSEIDPPP